MAFITTFATAACLALVPPSPLHISINGAHVIKVVGEKGGGIKKGTAKKDFNRAAKPTLCGAFNSKSGAAKRTLKPKGPIWKPPSI